MQIPDLSKRYSYDELGAVMDETNLPHELCDGELIISPKPDFRHQKIVPFVAREMQEFVQVRKLGKIIISSFEMVVSPRRSFQPDVLFVARENLGRVQKVLRGPADLVVEVFSEYDRRRDRIDNPDLCAQHGIPEYLDDRSRSSYRRSAERIYRLAGRYIPIRRHRRCCWTDSVWMSVSCLSVEPTGAMARFSPL